MVVLAMMAVLSSTEVFEGEGFECSLFQVYQNPDMSW